MQHLDRLAITCFDGTAQLFFGNLQLASPKTHFPIMTDVDCQVLNSVCTI